MLANARLTTILTVAMLVHGWLEATPVVGQASPFVSVDTAVVYYELPDSTLHDVVTRLNGMRLEGARGPLSQGLTRYTIDAEYRAVAGGGRCTVSHLVVNAVITITLPSWPAVPRRPDRERQAWATIDGALREHENGHRDLTIEAAHELAQDLDGRNTRGCGVLGDVVATSIELAGTRLREKHDELDRNTPTRLPILR
jgi:predicted secreted Zn-dependent protease